MAMAETNNIKEVLDIKTFIEGNLSVHIDRDVFVRLWNIIESGDWIYLSRTLVLGELDYYSMSNFKNKVLEAQYVEGVDYKEVSADDPLVDGQDRQTAGRGGKKPLCFVATKKTIIMILCKAKTSKAGRYLEYFYEIENLLVQYYKSQYVDHKVAVNELLSMPKVVIHTREQSVKYMEAQLTQRSATGIVYFIHEEGDLTRFKIGWAYNLKTRLAELQIASWRELKCLKFIYCQQPSIVESMVHEEVSDHLIRGEWYAISQDDVMRLCALFE
jgi:hypothetical protein